ncbi:hypothetical protein LAZ67_6001381 [Cordylochernes scorpioides]|uniref:Uncharacterized protein n=1 Tax=Cordylochernes scorpioides TaxID=51811 RepID=A0ABY6KMU0_9ARAC|nr:hypothetical protein LAZ67_6001381 [Cordylochernes scorpioides]
MTTAKVNKDIYICYLDYWSVLWPMPLWSPDVLQLSSSLSMDSPALCGFFTCVNFGWHTSKVEAQILTGTNVGHTVLVPKIYFAPSDISLPFILKRHQFSLKLAFAMTINNI